MLCSLNTMLKHAECHRFGIAAFNVYGYEDALAIIKAAEREKSPVILGASMKFAAFMPIEIIGAMLTHLASHSPVPVCIHLDHANDLEIIKRATSSGFNSVMYDGSHQDLETNILRTRQVVAFAHSVNVPVEGAVGVVPDAPDTAAAGKRTELLEMQRFLRECSVDALAISVGNIHRCTRQGCDIDIDLAKEYAGLSSIPLVMHGTSGLRDRNIRQLSQGIFSKFNVGTVLRQAFGSSLRSRLERDQQLFDRIDMMDDSIRAVSKEAARLMRLLGSNGKSYEVINA